VLNDVADADTPGCLRTSNTFLDFHGGKNTCSHSIISILHETKTAITRTS
jgi:hypothetical protein